MTRTNQKIISVSDLKKWRSTVGYEAERVVFTNGCFDLIHAGHVLYLQEARSLGDYLVVGVNSDASVRKLKGAERPVMPLRQRLIVLAGLESVSLVVPMNSTLNCDLMRVVQPHIWVKGGDYTHAKLAQAEKDTALELSVEIKLLSMVPMVSTSRLLAKVSG